MRVVVLGAEGQVGRALLATRPADAEVLGLGRNDCDLADESSIGAALGNARPGLVINAAAYTAVDAAEENSEQATRINSVAPGIIGSVASELGAKVVHISTDFVFDGTASTPRQVDDPVNPIGVYGRSKLQGEREVAKSAPSALIVRTAWVHAPEGRNFVLSMLRLMGERERVSVVSDQIGTPTYAPSLATALWSLARLGATGVHHFTDAGVCSWYDFAVAIQEEALAIGLLRTGCEVVPIRSSEYPTPARRPSFSVLDKGITWAELGEVAAHWRANLRLCLHEIGALRAGPNC